MDLVPVTRAVRELWKPDIHTFKVICRRGRSNGDRLTLFYDWDRELGSRDPGPGFEDGMGR